MKNRYIVTPKDKESAELLDYNKATDNDLIELAVTDEQFNSLNSHNVFSAPVKRAGMPNEIAPSFLFLTSEDSLFMSGQVLHPNGGETVNS